MSKNQYYMPKGTKTSSFGSSKRENHDASDFYDAKLYSNYNIEKRTEIKENKIPDNIINTIICHDSRDLSMIPDNSVHLVITSPPYNVSKDYDEDLSLDEYLDLIRDVMEEVYRVLIWGGRLCLNVANIGRKPYIPLSTYFNQINIDIGFLMRGEVIWNKEASAGTSTAWGSWKSASNAILRDVHEYILIYSKGDYTRKHSRNSKNDTITKEDFLELTKSVWSFDTASAKKVGHPAPFPLELPRRCIELFSFEDDIILDPFVGAGTTAIAAAKANRKFIGTDIDEEYCNLAKNRIKEEISQKSLGPFFTD